MVPRLLLPEVQNASVLSIEPFAKGLLVSMLKILKLKYLSLGTHVAKGEIDAGGIRFPGGGQTVLPMTLNTALHEQ